MRSVYEKKIKRRTIILVFFNLIWLGAIIIRLVQLQVLNHKGLKTKVIEQNQKIDKIHPKRGTILDRSGIILARSIPIKSIYYTPDMEEPLESQMKKIGKLKSLLKLSQKKLLDVRSRIENNTAFIWIKRKVAPEISDRIEELKLDGINFTEENKRFYPHGRLASHIIGTVNLDNVGDSGIEYKYNSQLEGEKGKRLILKDAKKRKYRFQTIIEPKPGKDLVLTIDETIQYIAEKEMEKAIAKTGGTWGTVIISQPSTGEIRALANYPAFDLNSSRSDRNEAIRHTFDPGSTFKIITASAALETNKVRMEDTFDCSLGYIQVPGKPIRDHQRFGVLTFPEVIIHSSNIGTVQIGRRIGANSLYEMIKIYGFGQKTGIDLPAEENGIFREIQSWSRRSLSSLSIGYEISVTAIQMLQAVNIIANRGVVASPRIVKEVKMSSENKEPNPAIFKKIISEETAAQLTGVLLRVVEEGTGTQAQIKGFRVAGKTGTAQKIDPVTKAYSAKKHIASFVGFVSTNKPVFSMIVVIDEPKGQFYGGDVAAPVFKEIAKQVLMYLRIPPQKDPETKVITARNRRQDNK